MFIPVGDYRPDLGDYGTHDTIAGGVFPTGNGYKTAGPLKALTTADIGVTCKGGFSARSHAGSDINFFASSADLFTFDSTSSTSASKSAGAYSTPNFWEFTRFGNYALAVNGAQTATAGDPIQQYELDSAGAFSDVAGAPNAEHIATVKDFVVVGDTWDSVDGFRRNRVRWCAIGDHTSWTVSAVTQADYNDLPFGTVKAVVGGEYGVVVTESSVWRMTYVGSPLVFQFDEVLPGIGTNNPASVVKADNFVFMWATDGFRVIANGSETKPIGKARVDDYMKTNWTDGTNVVAVVDPIATRVYWWRGGYVICYDWILDKWSEMNTTSTFSSIEYLFASRGIGATNSEEIVVSRTTGSGGDLWHFGDYTGTGRQPVQIRKAFKELTPNRHTLVTRAMPVSGGAVSGGDSVQIEVLTRNDVNQISGNETTYTETAHTGTGTRTFRADGRYHSFELATAGSNATTHEHHGINIDSALPRGTR